MAVAVARLRRGVGALAPRWAFRPVGMRWAVEDVRGWTAVNDGYNANPVSMRAALEAFATGPRRGGNSWRWDRCWNWAASRGRA
jgi:UDP-N-acetylmuramyl pentapeptide synthase